MKSLFIALRLQLPFLAAGFLSFLFSVWLYFVMDEKEAGLFVGLWVPSIHTLGTLLLTAAHKPVLVPAKSNPLHESDRVRS
jgi:hypothetical protein